jgi:hypothetical protein
VFKAVMLVSLQKMGQSVFFKEKFNSASFFGYRKFAW